MLIYSFFPCVLPEMGGMGGWNDKSFPHFSYRSSSTCAFYQTHNIFHFERMYITQISVRSLCISAKQLRPVDGEHTGNTSPSSILHPQHIHLVVVEHMVQFLIVSNGIRHGSSWYLASGRIAFAFSSQYRLIKVQPIFMCSASKGRNCFSEMHKLRTDIWIWMS